MRVIMRGVVPDNPMPVVMSGQCDDCGSIVEAMSDDKELTPHYYGEPGSHGVCPVCGDRMWFYGKKVKK